MLNIRTTDKSERTFKQSKDLLVFDLIDKSLEHSVFKKPLCFNQSDDIKLVIFGMGCFWGVEKLFWGIKGVLMTAVGYSAGSTEFPNYKLVCSGATNHNEVVLIHFSTKEISFYELLKIFWESHNPTQGMRQGNDIGTQYRSGVYVFSEQDLSMAEVTKKEYSHKLSSKKFSQITTEILPASKFYYAEEYHQQYLIKNPNGYCALSGTGVNF